MLKKKNEKQSFAKSIMVHLLRWVIIIGIKYIK